MNISIALIVVGVIAVVAIAALIYVLFSRRRSRHLKERFGPEYEKAVADHGSAGKAEAQLGEREKRVEKLHIVPVPPELRERFALSWRQIQARFVDEPGAAVAEADGLVRKVMESRGYPIGSFEQRAADISVDHPGVVEHYRAAQEIAQRREQKETSTEDLRQAFVHYRALFEELLEAPELVEVHRG